MKLKLSDSLIERIARFDSIFYNGNILHDSGAVMTIHFLKTQNSDAPYEICSIVHDFTGREYHAEADFELKETFKVSVVTVQHHITINHVVYML